MGMLDMLRGELIDVVEWMDDSRHTLVWRFPRFHNQIKQGAQLIVRPGQTAVFVREGRIADHFEPGQYRLETRNLPVLSTMAGWKYGFDSPFKAEVYFVNTRQLTDLKWGTPSPVIMRDPDYGALRVRAFGSYTLRARDPKILLAELVGTDSDFQADEISELIRSIVNATFANLIAGSEIAVLDLASNYEELAEILRERVLAQIDDEFGLEIPQLYIVNISLPEEVEKALDSRTSLEMIDDLQAYQAYQIGRSMPAAAENPAGGLAGAGLGVGMGMAVAGQMLPGSVGPAGPPAPGVPPLWHVAEGDRPTGPFSPTALAEAAGLGRLRADSLVWTRGMRDWAPAASVPALADLFQQTGPPPIPR